MEIVSVTTGEDGASRFGSHRLAFEEQESIGGALPQCILPTTATRFIKFHLGMEMGLHNAPRRQLVTVLQGVCEVETGDGATRRFQPGETFLAEDTEGQGHKTRCLGEQALMLMFSHLE